MKNRSPKLPHKRNTGGSVHSEEMDFASVLPIIKRAPGSSWHRLHHAWNRHCNEGSLRAGNQISCCWRRRTTPAPATQGDGMTRIYCSKGGSHGHCNEKTSVWQKKRKNWNRRGNLNIVYFNLFLCFQFCLSCLSLCSLKSKSAPELSFFLLLAFFFLSGGTDASQADLPSSTGEARQQNWCGNSKLWPWGHPGLLLHTTYAIHYNARLLSLF